MPIKFVITGFSSFSGVPKNPTELLIEQLQMYCKEGGELSESILHTAVLRVAAHEVRRWLKDAATAIVRLELGSDISVLWLHLGVDVGAHSFKLESRAYNNATFRTPDEDHWQPVAERIDADADFGSYCTTDLPLESYQAALADEYDVTISFDPGRFLCNWIYYLSLLQSQEDRKARWHSLFVHVPAETCTPVSKQMEFLISLLQAMSGSPSKSVAEALDDQWAKGHVFA